jgi:osmoprotectant transport system ATP-binding protein
VARALAADPLVLLMDEPFSAVDPIVRARLQEEFLRLQAEVRKTIVLVTHDLDEAVRLGDRIAVLSQGGMLEQYDEPARLLGAPASPFVREFVGTDRGIRQLAVTPVTAELVTGVPAGLPPDAAAAPPGAPPPGDRPAAAMPDLPTLPLRSSLYDALAAMLTAGTDRVLITDEAGAALGVLHRDAVFTATPRST